MSLRSRLPLVTLILIAANIFAAFSMLLDPDLAYRFGFRSNQPSLEAAFTCLFLHANVLHLLGNMVFLAAVGAAVELATGSIRFIVVYLVSGLAGVGGHYLMTHNEPHVTPLIGASGCIAGCAAYYCVRYTSLRVAIAPRVALSVAAVTGVWLALQILGAIVRIGDSGGIAFWAHIGGFAAGAVLAVLFRAPDLQQIKLDHEFLNQMNSRGPAAAEFAAKRHLAKHPGDLKATWDLADAQHDLNESEMEAETLVRLTGIGSEIDQIEAIRRLCKIGRVSVLPTLKRLQLADKCHSSAPAIERALLVSVVEGPTDDSQRPDAMLALAGLELDSKPEFANDVLTDLVTSYPMHPAADLARKRGWVS